ncbi:translational GTPase TypA [Blastopirellula sp. JC732]|uniref:Large ribosomal subunit assembly factor BipA n=1 Tax=Blastopirellula sediminis TaxID=2894196 RepID=A0A9X1SJ96_9BACT|nr:translational GTPase TypA [Blastopirellula sediminis]MCC9604574.1 translational GTPase TypA [Blastopirellula sediminis]MCC9632127.1 translational GTPase TypA [Blastopirellula sediminis]
MRRDDIRNIVIIAHVDHGKTTLVDCLLKQSGQFRESQLSSERILDSNDQEKERGITILAKNIALPFKGVKINIIDTPGHADFGGEVERVLSMADGALVLVDAAEGPMPQTRFVLSKALECKLKPIVVINKVDKPDARPMEVVDEVLDLFLQLGADDSIADFPYIFASAKEGFASHDPADRSGTMEPLLDLVLEHIPGPDVQPEEPLQILCTTLAWSEYVGRIAIGRIQSGRIKKGQNVVVSKVGDKFERAKITAVQVFENLGRVDVEQSEAGDVVAVCGIENIDIGDTICHVDNPSPLPRLLVDEPTLEMVFTINTSPFVGKDGKYVTSRNLRERLYKELERNVALRVRDAGSADAFAVSGRGVLHLAVLVETMRREGYELAVSKPQVITREVDGTKEEPFENLVVEVPSIKMGPVMELVGERRGEMVEMNPRGDFTQVTFSIPARGLIGLRTKMLNATQGEAIINHRFDSYRPMGGDVPRRANGVLISNSTGKAVGFSLFNLQDRSDLFIKPGEELYEGMIVGENARNEDMVVNPIKEKKLTNMRASGSDENIVLKPPRQMSLEAALEYIEDDELVEVTPNFIRLRKMMLKEADRRRGGRRN